MWCGSLLSLRCCRYEQRLRGLGEALGETDPRTVKAACDLANLLERKVEWHDRCVRRGAAVVLLCTESAGTPHMLTVTRGCLRWCP